jgi:hypothetical protein
LKAVFAKCFKREVHLRKIEGEGGNQPRLIIKTRGVKLNSN